MGTSHLLPPNVGLVAGFFPTFTGPIPAYVCLFQPMEKITRVLLLIQNFMDMGNNHDIIHDIV